MPDDVRPLPHEICVSQIQNKKVFNYASEKVSIKCKQKLQRKEVLNKVYKNVKSKYKVIN